MVAMKTFSLLLVPSFVSISASEAGAASHADVQAQQAQLAKDMGNSYKSMYAPGAVGASPDAASQAKPADEMGKFYRAQYAPAGMPVSSGSSQADVQAQQSKLAADMGKHFRSQYAPPGIEDQIEAQQAAQAAKEKAEAAEVKTPEVLLLDATSEATTVAPIPQDAKDCKTMDQLKAWMKARKDNLEKYVPKDYRHFAIDSLQKEYDANAKRIQAPPAPEPKPEPAGPSPPPALLLASEGQAPSSPDPFADFTNRFKHEVKDVDQRVQQKSDSTAQKVDSAADSVKEGIDGVLRRFSDKADKANVKVKSQVGELQKQISDEANKVQQGADAIAKQISEEQTPDQAAKPSQLLEQDASFSRLHRLMKALTLFGGPLCIAGLVAYAAIKHRARQMEEESVQDYFMAL